LLAGAAGFVFLLLLFRIIFLLGTLDPSQERVVEVLAPAEVVWSQGPERPLYDREELYTGTAAEAIRMGLDLPLSTYRFMPYGSGSLIISLLAVPIYALFGPHYLALKLLALLITVLGGLFWFQVVRAWLGHRVAWCFGLLYIFAPPVLVRTALIAKGDHPEAMAIVGAVLLLASRAAFCRNDRSRARWAAACGLLAGLGIWVTYSTVPVLVGAGLAALVWTRLRPIRIWVVFGAGLVVGLLPWFATLLNTPDALRIYGQPLGAAGAFSGAMSRMQILLNRGLMASYDLPGGLLGGLLGGCGAGLFWLLAVGLGWITLARTALGRGAVVRDWRRPVAALALAATVTHLAAFCLRAPDPSSRYLVPGYPLFLIAVAFLIVPSGVGARRVAGGWRQAFHPRRWCEAFRPRCRREIVVAAIVLLGLVSQIWAVQDSRFAALRAPLSGTDWPLLGEVAGWKLSAEAIAALPVSVRPFFWVGFGRRVFSAVERERWEEAAALAGPDGVRVWEGIGIGWMGTRVVTGAPRLLPRLSGPARTSLRHGLARYGEEVFAPLALVVEPAGLRRFLDSFAEEDRGELLRSFERTLATLITHGVGVEKWTSAIARDVVREEGMLQGAGWSLYRDTQGERGLRLWDAPQGSWPALLAASIREGRGAIDLWRAIASAYEWDISTRGAAWLLGGKDGPTELAQELSRLALWLAEPAAAEFYQAAGRSAGRARAHPSRAVAVGDWDWRAKIPKRFQSAFLSGLEETSDPRR
jgi:4-amino-4-deoxy-L-arabinose transferase-like glycosyltransferase